LKVPHIGTKNVKLGCSNNTCDAYSA